MTAAVNVRRIMAGHHRKLCCPLLKKLFNECILLEEDKFVTCEELFAQYKSVMEVRTVGDSLNGQTRSIMKKRAFSVVRVLTHDLKL